MIPSPYIRRRLRLAPLLAILASSSTSLKAQEAPIFYIKEYRVAGSTKLSDTEIGEIVYPYLGPARTTDDVEKARLALEAAFRAKGYQTVSVQIPQQDPRYGVIRLQVVEGTVGRLRVKGAKWFLPSRIKQAAPSLAEGGVPNLDEAQKEIVALNRLADRRVIPKLRPGTEPGTVDIDLEVEDKLPLHGSIELNNRYSADTTRLRLNGSLSYGNLFQLGHTIGTSFQVAPENPDESLVFSGYYLSRINDGLSLMLQGTKQDSNVSTLGGATSVIGAGEIIGLRAIVDLPSETGHFHNLTFGLDWKNLEQATYLDAAGGAWLQAPIEYFPLSASYASTWVDGRNFTEFNLTGTLGLRGYGSDESTFDDRRFKARGNFFHLRGDLSHTRDLADGSQLYGKLQGQLASGPLINSEQFSGGGLGNARGYLESESLGDNGIFATFEYRTPSLIGAEDENGRRDNEWRFHTFLEGGVLGIYEALPGQDATTTFLSGGIGTRFKYAGHLHGSLDLSIPFLDGDRTDALDPFLSFRGWADF
ncbi:MAG: ShlB/FhaC/HecB family hemolysin secretion/activation protein [Akkermansiaceae bacterium]|nr:ShlB/FhaC/HecB family hemolysin secretion/activation protein [Akkermansiaceae bacterium]